jgi:hypothetical protein
MESLFIDRVRINECLCDSLSPTCLALAGLVQRTKPSIFRPCALSRLGQLTEPGLVQLGNELNLAYASSDSQSVFFFCALQTLHR